MKTGNSFTHDDYAALALESRQKVLELVYKAQGSHIGSLLGAADIFAVVFPNIDLDKDKFILSAGWKAALLYFHLWKKGRITLEQLDSYCQEGSPFIGLAEPIHPDIPFAGGSMGYGLPGAVGFALAKKLKGEEGTVYCYMSDGELAVGTTHEAALIAAHHNLDNLVVIVECNGFQAMGRTRDILPSPGWKNWDNIGWNAYELNGHSYKELDIDLTACFWEEGPSIIFASTIKGKGVSFMLGNNTWHYKAPSEEEYKLAKQELS